MGPGCVHFPSYCKGHSWFFSQELENSVRRFHQRFFRNFPFQFQRLLLAREHHANGVGGEYGYAFKASSG